MMRLLANAVMAVAAAMSFVGCMGQSMTITTREYYEPTGETINRREDGYAVGAIKSETIRSGARDEGEKSFTFGVLNIND